jgi:hypothetical protein
MTQSAYGLERRPVEYTPAPASHLWIAICLAVGAGALAGATFLGLAEIIIFHVKSLVLEAIFLSPK